MSNHYHLVLHVNQYRAKIWSVEEVVERLPPPHPDRVSGRTTEHGGQRAYEGKVERLAQRSQAERNQQHVGGNREETRLGEAEEEQRRCRLFGDPRRPAACGDFQASVEVCGSSPEQAITILDQLEMDSLPDGRSVP